MRTWFFLCLLPLAVVSAGPEALGQTASSRPNVLLIVVDDMNCVLGCYGNSVVKSPNIDRLAAKGVRFERAYCQYPLCNPTRTSFLSGRRPDTTGILDNQTPPRRFLKQTQLLPDYLRSNGYFVARSGKIIHTAPTFPEDAIEWDWSDAKVDANPQPQPKKAIEGGADGAGVVARRIIRLMNEHKDKPFFCAAGFTNTHCRGEGKRTSFVPVASYLDLYKNAEIPLPQEPADHRGKIPPLAISPFPQDVTTPEMRQHIAGYYACVSYVDAQVGALMNAMDRLKLWENTVVVFLGDHGQHLGEHGGTQGGFWRKETLFEEALRVPLVVVAPGKRVNAVSPRLVELVDLYPTLTQLCGLPTPQGMEGLSFVPLLDEPDRAWKKAAFSMVKRRQNGRDVLGRSVRTERYRYSEWDEGKQGVELYDHDLDPHEFNNLAQDPQHSATVSELRGLLKEVAAH